MNPEYTSLPQNPPPSGQYNPPQIGYQPPPSGYGYPQQGPAPGGFQTPLAAGGYNPSQIPSQGYPNQPIPQPGVAPPPLFGPGIQYVYVPNPLEELALSTGVLIKQQVQFLERITGCESPNRYYVFSQSPQGGMKLLFKCKEMSGCCMRNCCPADNREFNMLIKHINSYTNFNEDFSKPFVHVSRPFKCTCCCLERPEMLCTFGENSQPLGRIKQPFSCCDPLFSIYDNTGSLKYTIHAECCQCGLICKNNFCGKLSEVLFNIYNSSNITSNPVGSIIKKVATAAEMVTSADSYQINFPPQADPNDKMLLIIAGLMIDYQFFEESASQNNNSSHVYYN